jgi:hypothetical protein
LASRAPSGTSNCESAVQRLLELRKVRLVPEIVAACVAKVDLVSGMELEPVSVRALPREASVPLPVRSEAKTAAIAAAGGVLAGAATVAAVRAVGAVASRKRSPRRVGRREGRQNVVASRSFLVDVHLLGR